MTQVSKNLQAFVERALAITPQGHFWMPFDPDWRSPCELEFRREQAGTQVAWRPLPQTTRVSFDGLANALEQPIHPDICTYFSCYWSGSLEAQTNDGHVSLIQLWNLEDFDRLIENLIGHSLAKRQQREPFTVFFRDHRAGFRIVFEYRQSHRSGTAGGAGQAALANSRRECR